MQDAKQLLHQPAENTRQLLKNTLGMAWPAVLESFFIALAGMIDVKMVSNLGSYAVAAVGLTTQPKFLGLAFFIATNVALSALVARRFGEKRREDANQVMITALVMSILVCAVISTLCVTLANPIINLCGSQPDTHAAAVTYFRIIMGGIIFSVISMTINAALRGSGNTRIAMTTNVTSSVLNICGNYLLIEGHFGFPALGIAGAAIATVFGTVVACGMSIFSLRHPDGFVSLPHIFKIKIRPAWKSVQELFRLSGNILVENLLMRIGFIATALVAASLGTDVMAAHQVGMNVLTISFSFGDGMQVAAVALTGRSLGEGQKLWSSVSAHWRHHLPHPRHPLPGLWPVVLRAVLPHRATHRGVRRGDHALLYPHHLFPNLLGHLYGLSPCRRRCEIYPVCLGHQHHSCAYRLYLSVGAGTALGSDRCVDGRPHRSELPIDLGLYPFPAREVGGFENLTKTSFFH